MARLLGLADCVPWLRDRLPPDASRWSGGLLPLTGHSTLEVSTIFRVTQYLESPFISFLFILPFTKYYKRLKGPSPTGGLVYKSEK